MMFVSILGRPGPTFFRCSPRQICCAPKASIGMNYDSITTVIDQERTGEWTCGYDQLQQSNLSRKVTSGSSILGGETTIVARGGRCFAPRLDPLVPSSTECRYYSANPTALLPACVYTVVGNRLVV